jgi:hypothetical protein
MNKSRRIATVLTLCLLISGALAEDFAVPSAEQALEKIKTLAAATCAKSSNVFVWIKVFGKQQKVNLKKADADSFTVLLQGNPFDQKWSKTPAEDILQIAKGCAAADDSGALVVADYCLATDQRETADEMLTLAAQNAKIPRDEIALRTKALAKLRGGPAKTEGAAAGNGDAATGGSEKTTVLPKSPPKLDKANALKEVSDVSLGGLHRRFGPDYSSYHSSPEKFPDIYMPPEREEKNRKYQIGGPWTKDAGDYSSTQGQVLYVPDSGFGVDRVTIIEMSHNCFTEKPLPPWWGGYRPEPASASWLKGAGGNPGMPIGMSRGMVNWSNSGVAVFSSGFVGVAGTCTAKGTEPTLQLPRTKIPTAIFVTPKNEFALITVCDTEKMQGQLAVIALESSAKKTNFFHEWHEDHPGLPNVAVYTRMKLLGYIDLPGIVVPTGVSSGGNYSGGRLSGPDGNIGVLSQMDLGKQGTRDGFYKGNNGGYASSSGYAAVIARHEDKVAFVDLQPLFQYYREMYFTSEENYRKTRDAGDGPKQWPFTFEAEAAMKPVFIGTQNVPQPTAVLCTANGGKNARTFVASLDGKIHFFAVGGLATDEPAAQKDIGEIGSIQAGKNPCCLAYQKHSGDSFIVVSRGDREIQWVKYTDKGAEIVRKLRDNRMIDPVNVEVSDTHGIETAIITVADFKGRKIINYRYSPVVFATQGGAKFGLGPDGKDEFECGGVMEFPGAPFLVSASNVN